MLKVIKYLLFIVPVILFFHCASPTHSFSSVEDLYKKNNLELDIKCIVYHVNDSISELFFTLSNQNLVYKRPDTSLAFYASVKLRVSVTDLENGRIPNDTASIHVLDRQGEKVIPKDLNGSLKIKLRTGARYFADISIFDHNKRARNMKVLEIDKLSHNSRENFLLQRPNGKLIYDYYLYAGDTVIIRSQQNPEMNLVADIFAREFPMPPRVFDPVVRNPFIYKSDSFFVLGKREGVFKTVVPAKGLLHIITDKETKQGLTLFSVDEAFPGIKDNVEMIRATHYIMQSAEYKKCMEASNKKEAIDLFWKDLAGSNERARELIKHYYGRVKESNRSFTCHSPGWKTDRGMVFIVFGGPSKVYKYKNGEEWIYGSEAQPNYVKFIFKKVLNNPFSDNDYELERSELLKAPWWQAVNYWRDGRIYMDN
jgi:GWxTD domain-containing protein